MENPYKEASLAIPEILPNRLLNCETTYFEFSLHIYEYSWSRKQKALRVSREGEGKKEYHYNDCDK
jgi:hypothetical protein